MDTITNYWPIKGATLVLVVRNHVNGHDPVSPNGYQYGPLPLKEAEKTGLFETSGGTMSAYVTVAQGEYAGAPIQKRNGRWFAVTEESFCNGIE